MAASLDLRVKRVFSRVLALGLDRRDDTRLLLKWLEEDPVHDTVIQELEDRIRDEEALTAANPDPFRATTPWVADAFGGSLRLGRVVQTGQPFCLDVRYLTQHGLICGRTRGGKTHTLRLLIHELLSQHPNIKVLIIERKKQFTDIAREFGFHVATLKTLRINPLRPPDGVPHHIWVSLLTQMMVDHLDILTASSSFILSMCMRLYREWNVLDQWDRPHPNLRDLYNLVASQRYPAPSHTARYQESTLNRIADVLNSFPGVFECDRGFDFATMSKENTLLLMHEMPNLTMQNFMAAVVSSPVFLHRLLVMGEKSGLELLLVLDEATPFFRRRDELREKPSHLGTVISQAGAFGLGIVATSQFTSDLSHALLGNTATKIVVGGFERGEDVQSLMSLRPHTREQEEAVKGERQVGRAFVSDPRHKHFIEIQIDERQDLPGPMTDAEILRAAEDTARRLGWMASSTHAQPPPQPTTEQRSPAASATPPVADTVPAGIELPPKRDGEILADMAKTPFETIAKRARRLKMPPAGLATIVKAIESRGEVVIYHVHGRSGRPADLYEVTDLGYGVLGIEKPTRPGKGGYLHQFYQERVAAHFKSRGHQVSIEGRAGDKHVDIIAVDRDGRTLGVEIELNAETSESFLRNLLVDLAAARISKVLVLAPTRDAVKVVRKAMQADGELKQQQGRVEVDLISSYMDAAK